jgi:hypothetical protein
MGMDEVLDLHREDVFTTGDDDILLPIHEVDKAILILPCYIPCVSFISGGTEGALSINAISSGYIRAFLANISPIWIFMSAIASLPLQSLLIPFPGYFR